MAITARWWLAIAVFGFGCFAVGNWTSPKWIAVTLAAYGLPLLAQASRSSIVRVYGIWIGVFLVLQWLLTPLVIDRHYITLPPDMNVRINAVGDALPGIQGLKTITTDSAGFRVTQPVDYTNKTADTFRIFAIGGSTTEQLLRDDR